MSAVAHNNDNNDEAYAKLSVVFKKAGIGAPLPAALLVGKPEMVANMVTHIDLISNASEETVEDLKAKISALREAKEAFLAFVRDFASS